MKMLHIGDFQFYFYDQIVSESFEKQGITVYRFKTTEYIFGFFGKVEYYFSFIGPLSLIMHFAILKKILKTNPDFIFIWRGTLISKKLLMIIKSMNKNIVLISYNNDNPFSPLYNTGNLHQRFVWRNFKKTIPLYDINLVFRPSNIYDYEIVGSKKTLLFPPFFIPKLIDDLPDISKIYDVIFIGHYTSERAETINYLVDQKIKVKIFGTLWKPKYLSTNYSYDKNIKSVTGLEYHNSIKSAKIALSFFSKLNQDVYTIRSFEIPPLGTVMLSERSKEIELLFEENKEAVFFDSKEDLLNKINFLLKNENVLNEIAIRGKHASYSKHYDVDSRVQYLLEQLK